MKILDVSFAFNMIGEKLFDEQANLFELQKLGHKETALISIYDSNGR